MDASATYYTSEVPANIIVHDVDKYRSEMRFAFCLRRVVLKFSRSLSYSDKRTLYFCIFPGTLPAFLYNHFIQAPVSTKSFIPSVIKSGRIISGITGET
jgi:hypothetical protein